MLEGVVEVTLDKDKPPLESGFADAFGGQILEVFLGGQSFEPDWCGRRLLLVALFDSGVHGGVAGGECGAEEIVIKS